MKSETYEAPEPNVVPAPKLTLVKFIKPLLSRETAWRELANNLRAFQPKPGWRSW